MIFAMMQRRTETAVVVDAGQACRLATQKYGCTTEKDECRFLRRREGVLGFNGGLKLLMCIFVPAHCMGAVTAFLDSRLQNTRNPL